jgi:DNA-binding CsgD family transcriptional regulator
MRPKDVRECVEIVATHPVLGPRYGPAIADLKAVWLGLLGREAFRAFVFEEVQDSSIRMVGIGVSAFVSDDYLLRMKTPPFFWVGPDLTMRIARGESPLLSDKETREANQNGGLNQLTWAGAVRTEYTNRPDIHAALFPAFVEQHRGFLLKEIIANATTPDQLLGMLRSGGQLLNTEGKYVDSVEKPLHEVFTVPHCLGLTREVALSRTGSWVGSLFIHESPRFCFRPSEQRLLLTALRGGTDEELSDELGISHSAIKKTWLLIYERVSAYLPVFSPNHEPAEGANERGKEKKQRLLAYLREHPEELRPAAP